MIKVVVCDDSPFELKQIETLLTTFVNEVSSLDLKYYNQSVLLGEDIKTLTTTDIFLLDIVMPDVSGIALGKKIRTLNEKAVIIFLTTSKEYALDAYGIQALQYLLKPIQKNDLFDALKKALVLIDKQEQYYSIQTRTEIMPVRVSDIKCVEYRDHVLYFTVGHKVVKSKFYRTTFDVAVQSLFEQTSFVLSHRSYLVNMDHVGKMTNDGFILNNHDFVPISKNRLLAVRKIYMNYYLRG